MLVMTDKMRDAFHYYLTHQAELVTLYDGKVIALQEGRVLGAYKDEGEAIAETLKTEQQGTFIIQRVSPGDRDYTVRFATADIFR
jgi:hypothetical protein